MATRKLVVRMMVVGVSVTSVGVGLSVGGASAQVRVPDVAVPDLPVAPPSVPVAPPALPVTPPSVPSPPSLQPPVNVPEPAVPVPSLPRAPSVPGTSAPGDTSAPTGGRDAAPGSAPREPGASGGAERGGPDAGRRGGGEGSAGGPRSPSTTSRPERSLQREVRALSGCFASLPRFERRVLDLRTGRPGETPARSRRTVARRLDVSLQRVRGAERDGLRQLRSTDRASGCGGVGSSELGTVWNDLMAGLVAGPALAPLASLEGTGGGDAGATRMASRGAVLGDRASSPGFGLPVGEAGDGAGDEGAGTGGGVTRTAAASLDGAGGPPLLVWLLAGLAALAVVAATPLLRRQRSGAEGPKRGAVVPARDAVTKLKADPHPDLDREGSAPRPDRPAVASQAVGSARAVPAARPPAPEPPRPSTPPHRTKGRAVGLAVSSAASLAVGLAMRARRRSGSRRRR